MRYSHVCQTLVGPVWGLEGFGFWGGTGGWDSGEAVSATVDKTTP